MRFSELMLPASVVGPVLIAMRRHIEDQATYIEYLESPLKKKRSPARKAAERRK